MAQSIMYTRELNTLARLERQRTFANQDLELLDKAIEASKVRVISTAYPNPYPHTFNEIALNLHNELKKL